MILAESTALGLDQTWWTAIGVLVALGISVFGLFAPGLLNKLRSAVVVVQDKGTMAFSSSLDGGHTFWVRLPIYNEGPSPARNIEIILQTVKADSQSTSSSLASFVPARLRWTHSQALVCDRIAEGTSKLVDFGVLYLRGEWPPAPPFDVQPRWRFTTEASPDYAPLATAIGVISVELAIVAEGAPVRSETLDVIFTRHSLGETSVEVKKVNSAAVIV